MEIKPEALADALDLYSEEVTNSHLNTPEDSLHIAVSKGMRMILYKLGILDKASNHDLVVIAVKAAETEIATANAKKNKRQGI